MGDDQPLPPVPTFMSGEKVCGNCKLWSAISVDQVRGWVGQCRVQPARGLFVPSAPICDVFAPRGAVAVARPAPEPERIKRLKNIAPVLVRRREEGSPALPPQTLCGPESPDAAQPLQTLRRSEPSAPASTPGGGTSGRRISRGDERVDFGDLLAGDSEVQLSAPYPPPGAEPGPPAPTIQKKGVTMTRAELMEIFLEATGQADVSLAPKWEGGVVQLVPKDGQAKEIPIDSLFHKVVMVRDKLRTLEQKLNAHPRLTDAEKVELQQYVTRCYGSLTTFNVLFREKGDQFTGQKGDE